MTLSRMVVEGMRRGLRHPGLVAVQWLVALVPAAMMASMFGVGLADAFDRSPSATRVLDGDWSGPWMEFLAEGGGISPFLGGALAILLFLTAVARIAVAGGIVEVLLERTDPAPRPFWTGMGLHFGRFLRSAAWFVLAMAPVLIAGGILFRVFRSLAERRMDGRFDLWGAVVTAVVLAVLTIPLGLAYDFGRIAVAMHRRGRTLRAFLAGLVWVLRRLGGLAPLYVVFFALPRLLMLAYFGLRGAWSPKSGAGILLLLALGQVFYMARAYLRIAFWGAEIAWYQRENEPAFAGASREAESQGPPRELATPPPEAGVADFQI